MRKRTSAAPIVMMGRRRLLETAAGALGGLVVGGVGTGGRAARAAPGDPVDPTNPIAAPIRRSGVAVELVDFATPPRTSSSMPYANLNFMYRANDGSGRVFVNDTRGKLWWISNRSGDARLYLDVRAARGPALLTDARERGLRSFAFHPNFSRRGAPGFRKLYTVSTETVASRPAGVRLFAGPFTPIHHDVVAEWTADATDASKVDPATRREVLRIAQPLIGHNTDQLMFDPSKQPGAAGFGLMYIGIADGGYLEARPDPYDQAQDPGRALGKIFCIDPLRQASGARYGAPSSNPFVVRAATCRRSGRWGCAIRRT